MLMIDVGFTDSPFFSFLVDHAKKQWLTKHYKSLNTRSSVCEREASELTTSSNDVEHVTETSRESGKELRRVLSDGRIFNGDDFMRRLTAGWEFGTKGRHV